MHRIGRAVNLHLQWLLACVEHHIRVDLSLGHAKAQRGELQLRVLENGARAQVFDRQVGGANDFFAGEREIHVHGVPAFRIEFGVGQYAALFAQRRGLGGAAAHEWAQIDQAQFLGQHPAFKAWTWLARGVGQAAMQIAGADRSVKVTVFPHRLAGLETPKQASAGLEGRCAGQDQSGERIQIRHARALQRHLQIDVRQRAGIGQDTLCLRAQSTCAGLDVKRVVHRLVAQRKNRSAQSFAFDTRLAVAALQHHVDAVAVVCLVAVGLDGIDARAQGEVFLSIGVAQPAAANDDLAKAQVPGGLVCIVRQLEGPVVGALFVASQHDVGGGQYHRIKRHRAAEQRQQSERRRHPRNRSHGLRAARR